MRQNLALSALILIVLIPLAATGALGLAAVVATHELAEVVVIANGVRAGRRTAFVDRAAGSTGSDVEPALQAPIDAAPARHVTMLPMVSSKSPRD